MATATDRWLSGQRTLLNVCMCSRITFERLLFNGFTTNNDYLGGAIDLLNNNRKLCLVKLCSE